MLEITKPRQQIQRSVCKAIAKASLVTTTNPSFQITCVWSILIAAAPSGP